MSLEPPESVRKLQTALPAKAKGSPDYRFYLRYDKVYRKDILLHAWQCGKTNGGAAGVDGQTLADIEAYGGDRWLGELAQALKSKPYRPAPVRRVYIPKPDGNERPLGIPTVKDRVVQTSAGIVLEPIFEADLPPEQYAYRPDRSALEAVKAVHKRLNPGHRQVVDADVSGYVDSIPHYELLKSAARRVSDRHLLHLITMWLEAPGEETDDRGRQQRTTRNKDERQGTPQGSPISPLLSNLCLRRFVLGGKVLGHEKRLDAHIVNDADDFVIGCRGSAEKALSVMRDRMSRRKRTVNETQTKVCRIREEGVDFLGYTLGRCYSTPTGKSYMGTRPSNKRIRRLCDQIRRDTERRGWWREVRDLVDHLNRIRVGGSNSFCLGPVRKAYRAVDAPARPRLRQGLMRKHKPPGRGKLRGPDEYLYQTLGLVRREVRTNHFPWAKAGVLVREPDAGNPHVRFDERDVETE